MGGLEVGLVCPPGCHSDVMELPPACVPACCNVGNLGYRYSNTESDGTRVNSLIHIRSGEIGD